MGVDGLFNIVRIVGSAAKWIEYLDAYAELDYFKYTDGLF